MCKYNQRQRRGLFDLPFNTREAPFCMKRDAMSYRSDGGICRRYDLARHNFKQSRKKVNISESESRVFKSSAKNSLTPRITLSPGGESTCSLATKSHDP